MPYAAKCPSTVRLDVSGRDATLLTCGNNYCGSRARLKVPSDRLRLKGATVLAGGTKATTVTVSVLDADAATTLATGTAQMPASTDASRMRRVDVPFGDWLDLTGEFTLEVTTPRADGGRVGTFGAKAMLNPTLAPAEQSFAVSTFPGSWIAAGVPLVPYAELWDEDAYGSPVPELVGKALVAIGDSLTDYTTSPKHTLGANWLSLLCVQTGMVPFCAGYGGTGYAATPSAGSAYLPYPMRLTDAYLPDKTDAVLVEGSVNDLAGYGGIPTVGLGTPSDEASGGGTYCARVRATLEALRARYPSATLLVASMPPTLTDNPKTPGEGTEAMVSAQRVVCADMGVPFLDLYHSEEMASLDAMDFVKKDDGSQDAVHFSVSGYLSMMRAMYDFVAEYVA